MNYTLIFNHLLRSICVNLLNHLELHLNFLPFLPYRKNGPLLYKKGESSAYKEDRLSSYKNGLVKADVDVSRIRFDRDQLAVSLTTLFVVFPVAFFYKTSLVLSPPDKKSADL